MQGEETPKKQKGIKMKNKDIEERTGQEWGRETRGGGRNYIRNLRVNCFSASMQGSCVM